MTDKAWWELDDDDETELEWRTDDADKQKAR